MLKPYVSIDIETTGLDPETCQILEIGAVIDDLISPIESLPTFHCYVCHEHCHGGPFALNLNSRILDRISKREGLYNFYCPDSVSYFLAQFFIANGLDTKHIQVAGKNFASFDLTFLKKLEYWDEYFKLNHRFLDPAMLWFDFYKDETVPDTRECLKRAGISGGAVAHEAVSDALNVIRLMRAAKVKFDERSQCQKIISQV